LEGSIFEKLITHVMYCNILDRKYLLKSLYTGLVTFVRGIQINAEWGIYAPEIQ